MSLNDHDSLAARAENPDRTPEWSDWFVPGRSASSLSPKPSCPSGEPDQELAQAACSVQMSRTSKQSTGTLFARRVWNRPNTGEGERRHHTRRGRIALGEIRGCGKPPFGQGETEPGRVLGRSQHIFFHPEGFDQMELRMNRGSGAATGMLEGRGEVEPQGQNHRRQHCQCGRNADPAAEVARSGHRLGLR